MTTSTPWIIVGGGLAGTLLAWEFHQRKQVFDWYIDPDRPASSWVAAGMYNPITGKRFAKTWQVETLQPFMETYYQQIESKLNFRFHHPKPALKLFKDEEEKQRWQARETDPYYQSLTTSLPPGFAPPGLRIPERGGFIVPSAGFVQVDKLLKAVSDALSPACRMFHQEYKDGANEGQTAIYCTGWFANQMDQFNALPLRHAHGDVLTIEAQEPLSEDFILNCGMYVLPLGENRFRVGATYDWDRLDPTPTEKGKKKLIEQLKEWVTVPFTVIEHEAGIRPTTVRRTPILGRLPEEPSKVLFNGLGSKGILNAPYYAHHLADHLLKDAPLDREVDIRTHLRIKVDPSGKAL